MPTLLYEVRVRLCVQCIFFRLTRNSRWFSAMFLPIFLLHLCRAINFRIIFLRLSTRNRLNWIFSLQRGCISALLVLQWRRIPSDKAIIKLHRFLCTLFIMQFLEFNKFDFLSAQWENKGKSNACCSLSFSPHLEQVT